MGGGGVWGLDGSRSWERYNLIILCIFMSWSINSFQMKENARLMTQSCLGSHITPFLKCLQNT